MNQQEIFTENLNYYLHASGKTQKQVCEDLDILPATFNLWVKGKNLPRMGKIQILADYFGILKTQLIDPRVPEQDTQAERLLSVFNQLDNKHKELLIVVAKSMLD